MRLRIQDCDDAAFAHIAPLLRQEDQDEWRAFTGQDALGLIASGYKLPTAGAGAINRIGYDELTGSPMAVWGASPLSPGVGWVWLVATPACVPVARTMHRYLQPEFKALQAAFPVLVTASWANNPVHHKWLDWLGFERGEAYLHRGSTFIQYSYMVKS